MADQHKIALAKERGAAIKKLQDRALESLALNKLFIVLWIRSDPPVPDDFHWAFYLHTSPQGGLTYEVKGLGSGWIPEHSETGGIFKTNFLCVLIEIATIEPAKHGIFDSLVRSYDEDLRAIPGVTCRVWLLEVIRLLAANRLVKCQDPSVLERECKDIGNRHSTQAAENEQPRPVLKAGSCS